MTAPSGAGRLGNRPGKSIRELAIAEMQIFSWGDVECYLKGEGALGANVSEAVAFYQDVLASEFSSPLEALFELRGIDFHFPVERVTLGARTTLLTYATTSVVSRSERPNEGRVRLHTSGRPLALHIGAFLTDDGVSPNGLGLAMATPRVGVKLRLLQDLPALKSRASGIVDTWSDRPTLPPGQARADALATPHIAQGGGVQYRTVRTKVQSDEYVAIL